jgi:hypothetical protein
MAPFSQVKEPPEKPGRFRLLRGYRPLIVIDWSDLKADRTWCLLRAAVPVGGRTLPVLDMPDTLDQMSAPS